MRLFDYLCLCVGEFLREREREQNREIGGGWRKDGSDGVVYREEEMQETCKHVKNRDVKCRNKLNFSVACV